MAGGPDIPDPNKAAIAGMRADAENYPFEYIINALSQMGGAATIGGQTYDFTGLGTAGVQAQLSDQMAQTLLDIQRDLGPQYVAQRIENLKQADPEGYAARKQLFDRILADAASKAPNEKLSADTQQLIQDELARGASLDARQLEEVQQSSRGGQLARGIYLGNAPVQQEAEAAVTAGGKARSARQGAAGQFLSSGVSPRDIRYRKLQQDMANLGAFLSGTTPTAQFASLSGAQSQAAPYPATGYQAMSLNPNAAREGVANAFGLYGAQQDWASGNANPYLAGLSMASGGVQTVYNLGWNPGGGTGLTRSQYNSLPSAGYSRSNIWL